MVSSKESKRTKWFLIIYLVIGIQILDKLLIGFFPLKNLFIQLSHSFINIAAIILLLFLLVAMSKTTKELSNSNQKLNNIFDSLDVAIWSHDLKSNVLMITPGIEKLYGYSLDDFYRDHLLWKKVVYPDDLDVLVEREQKLMAKESVTSLYRIIRPDGELRWIQDRGIPTYDEKGNFLDFTSVLFDVTEQKEGEERYRSLVEMSPDIIAVISDWNFDYINEAGSKIVGAKSPSELIGKTILDYVSAEDVEKIQHVILEMNDGDLGKNEFECQVIRADGETVDLEMSIMTILYEGRLARHVVGRDITERKKSQETIQYMAYYDALTGLPNRNMFKEHLHNLLITSKDQVLAVLFLDLDRFKIINDTKGHTTGDLLLKEVAKRLAEVVLSYGLVSRQGGDEFLVLLEDTTKEKAEVVSQRIIQAFSKPVNLQSEEFFVTPSIGISMYPDDGVDQETLIKNADTAMYLAKDRGKNNYQYYNPSLNNLSTKKMELEIGLRKALEHNQLMIYYQPQFELSTGEIVAVEALLRWQHPELGMISPEEFIPLAEESGLIVPLGNWVLRKVSEQHTFWKHAGLGSIKVGVNVSVRQLEDDKFLDEIKQILDTFNIEPQFLELEITESIMQNIERSTIILNQLKQLGVKISIDDFGKGYSSLSYLKHLPIDSIKIDKSFIDDILDQSNKGSIAKAIIDVGHNMNFTVIAEGIEHEEQVRFLLRNSCEIGQGFYFSKPLVEEDLCLLFQ